jgi:hypothetical protein
MPYELQLEKLPAGISLEAAKAGEIARIQVAGTATSEDGELLIRYLGFAGAMLDELRKQGNDIPRSKVDNLLAIIRRDRSVTLYVNELKLVSTIRIARVCEAGEPISKDDVIDIDETKLSDLAIPDDAGLIIVISQGWRKATLFDFINIGAEEKTSRHYDIWPTLGQLVAQLIFQERLSITDDDWKQLFAARWFPFAGLRNSTMESVIGHARAGWGVSELLPTLETEMLLKVDGFLDSWKKKEQFKAHIPLLEVAVERFKARDYISCTSIVFPRIEGVLRAHHALSSPTEPRTQATLSEKAVGSISHNPYSLLLPLRFQEYLRQVFFANFDDQDSSIPVSRNSAGHGVADAADFNLETAVLGLLICHQLFYCFRPDPPASGASDGTVST